MFHSLAQTEMWLVQKGLVKSLRSRAIRDHMDGGGEQVGSSTKLLRFVMQRLVIPSPWCPSSCPWTFTVRGG